MASGGKKLTGKERADLQRKQIVDKVIEDMDKGGFEWVKPWHDMAAPHNPVTGVTYRGGNRTHLLGMAMIHGYTDPRWVTFKNLEAAGWRLREGERSCVIEHWKMKRIKTDRDAPDNDPVLQERFLKFLEDGVKESGTGIFTISDAADLSEAGFTQAQAMEMFRFFDESDAFRSSVAIGRDPFITCYPALTDDIKAFGHPKLDQDQELVPLNERSILDCGEDEIDEVKHAAENSVIAAVIDPSRFNEVDAFAVRINEHGSEPTYDLLINQGMAAAFDQNNVDYKSGVDWALSMNGDSVTGFVATCHGAWPGGVERVTDIEFRRLTDGAGFAARQDLERIDELSDEARNAELGNLFEDASKLQPSDSLAEFIRSDIQRTVEFAVSEYAHEQTLGVDDWRIEAARADVIGDEEFNRIFGVDDDDRMGLSAFTGELKDAAEHKHGDDSISRNEPEHDGR